MYGFNEIISIDHGSTGVLYVMKAQADIPTIDMVRKLMHLGDNVVIEKGLNDIPNPLYKNKTISFSAHYFIDGKEVAHYAVDMKTLVVLEYPRLWADKFIQKLTFVEE